MNFKKHTREVSESGKQQVGMYSPWVIYFKQIKALFEKDPEIRLEFDSDSNIIKFFVDNPAKAEALEKILPATKTFGNIIVENRIIPSNNNKEDLARYVKVAFEGNEAFSHFTTIKDIPDMYISNPINYCVFKKEVVQYGADDLGSESGVKSTLYEDLARELLKDIGGVYFCTDTE